MLLSLGNLSLLIGRRGICCSCNQAENLFGSDDEPEPAPAPPSVPKRRSNFDIMMDFYGEVAPDKANAEGITKALTVFKDTLPKVAVVAYCAVLCCVVLCCSVLCCCCAVLCDVVTCGVACGVA